MSAYCLLDNLEITDPEKLDRYKALVGPIVRRHAGQYLVLGGKTDLLEGRWKPVVPVMIEFPSFAGARRWYASDEYRELKAPRLSAGRFNAVMIEGLQDPPAFMGDGHECPRQP